MPKVLREGIYESEISLYFGGSPDKAYRAYCKWVGGKPSPDGALENCDALTFSCLNSKRFGIWFRTKRPASSTVAHEATHYAAKTLRHIGMALTEETEEAYCYLVGWLVEGVNTASKAKKV